MAAQLMAPDRMTWIAHSVLRMNASKIAELNPT